MPSAATVAVEESMPSIAQILQGLSAADAAVIGPGTVLRGRFELQGLLGYGGMASVFKAVDRYRARLGLQDCCVALKIIAPHPPNPDHVAALGREFHNAQQLSHPNIINVYEIDHEGDASFYTMELLEGEQLNQLQERVGGLLPQRYALAIIRDIGEAIAHAHSRGVVHADLKPQNIFVTYGGQVRVLDFGGLSLSPATPDFGPRATLSASLGPPTGLATPFGPQTPWIADLAPELPPQSYRTATPAYASCEQLEGQRADPRDDVYALGCIAYELLAGRHPFEGKSATQARAEHLRPRRPPGLRTPSWRALRSALSWRRSQRPRHIGSWLEQLGIAAAAERLPPSHQLQAIQPPRLWLQRLAAATLLVAAAGAAAWAVQHNGPLDWQKTLHSAATTLQNAQQELRAGLGSSRRAAPASSAAPAVARAAPIIQAPVPALAPADPGGPSPGHSRPADADASTPAPGHTATAQPRHSRSSRGHARGARGSSPVAGAAAPVKAESPPNQDATVDAGNPGAGVTFATSSYAVADGAPAARLLIRRTGSFKGDLRFAWWTEEDSAKADVDYAPLGRRIEHIPPGADSVAIFVPIISNPLRHRSETFYVALGRPGEVDSEVPSARATVTIDRGG
jgi:serine/threonine protein kinase